MRGGWWMEVVGWRWEDGGDMVDEGVKVIGWRQWG